MLTEYRYGVSGFEDGFPVRVRFKNLKRAYNCAKRLKEWEIYDYKDNCYVDGNSKFYNDLRKKNDLP